jgi:hypothetical protein
LDREHLEQVHEVAIEVGHQDSPQLRARLSKAELKEFDTLESQAEFGGELLAWSNLEPHASGGDRRLAFQLPSATPQANVKSGRNRRVLESLCFRQRLCDAQCASI